MKKIIIVVGLIFVLGAGTAMAGTGEKNPFAAIWKAISSLQDKDNELERKNSELEKKIYCLELIKKTPSWGHSSYINTDIVNFYEDAKERWTACQADPGTCDYPGMPAKWETAFNESQPLYTKYMEECGEL
ncbi:hypothetical protein HOB10_04780 [Candidatus Parcubacteria bacterium]|jgi:hypothetical protein|nr:hypothetical protein [Candidatus Parcubacteria bacterium]